VLILVMVGIAHAIDHNLIGTGESVRTAVVMFYLSNEGVSLLENAARIGLPIPEKLKAILAQLRGKDAGRGN
jgi:toxin secretion/phage lysis holin